MNSENSKIFDPHTLLVNLLDKLNLKIIKDKYFLLSNLLCLEKYYKIHKKQQIKSKPQREIKN